MTFRFCDDLDFGLVFEQRIAGRWSLQASAGASGVYAWSEWPCEPSDGPDCTEDVRAAWVYARIGVAVRLRSGRQLAIDVGVWRGRQKLYRAGELRDRDPFLIPMLGVTYLVRPDSAD